MIKYLKYIISLLFLPASFCFAGDVVINEIGWSGTPASQYGEWVEFYNTSDSSVSLDGWTLFEGGGSTKIIDLAGTIQPQSYFLIERTRASSPDPVADIQADVSGMFGGSGLSNGGEYLILKNSSGEISDEASFSGGWPAGTAGPDYFSMERIDPLASGSLASNWASNNNSKTNGHDALGDPVRGTPKSENSVFQNSSPPLVVPPPVSSDDSPPPAASSPPPSSFTVVPPPEVMKVYAGKDITALAGQGIDFSGSAKDMRGGAITNARFLWNFGDGSTKEGKATIHTYAFPGIYSASLHASMGEDSASDYITVEVVSPDIIISEMRPGSAGFVELFNASDKKLEVSGLEMKDSSGGVFSIPNGTLMPQRAYIVFPNENTKLLSNSSELWLLLSNGQALDHIRVWEALSSNESFSLAGETFIRTNPMTPGKPNIVPIPVPRQKPLVKDTIDPRSAEAASSSKTPADATEENTEASSSPSNTASASPVFGGDAEGISGNGKNEAASGNAGFTNLALGPMAFLIISALLGAAGSIGFIFLKKML